MEFKFAQSLMTKHLTFNTLYPAVAMATLLECPSPGEMLFKIKASYGITFEQTLG